MFGIQLLTVYVVGELEVHFRLNEKGTPPLFVEQAEDFN